ncbi:MAG: 2-dehydro-3-deoxyphosphogluconate aldolase [Flavobacteriales bacterium 32-35-8]|nr:MAG: 2-dehydro-3-deoxyphosphogluconate aldolase [Flavobacteriales bacterium 32-35-8]
MKRQDIVKIIKEEKIIAIVRLEEQWEVPIVLEKLIELNIKVLEITSNTPGFTEEISKARKCYANSNVLIGAGTVTNEKIARKAIKAGAQFLVSPNTNIDVITIAHQNEIPVLMGALTPTEICTAVENGADFIKLFPAGSFGLDYFKTIKAPLNNVDFFIVGGINLLNVEDWMSAGASGVGLGSVLMEIVKSENSKETIENTVKQFLKKIKE